MSIVSVHVKGLRKQAEAELQNRIDLLKREHKVKMAVLNRAIAQFAHLADDINLNGDGTLVDEEKPIHRGHLIAASRKCMPRLKPPFTLDRLFTKVSEMYPDVTKGSLRCTLRGLVASGEVIMLRRASGKTCALYKMETLKDGS